MAPVEEDCPLYVVSGVEVHKAKKSPMQSCRTESS